TGEGEGSGGRRARHGNSPDGAPARPNPGPGFLWRSTVGGRYNTGNREQGTGLVRSPRGQGGECASHTPLFLRPEGQFLHSFSPEIAPRIRRGHSHHPHPLKFGGDPNPPDLVATGETRTWKNPIHTEITNFWNRVLRRINLE